MKTTTTTNTEKGLSPKHLNYLTLLNEKRELIKQEGEFARDVLRANFSDESVRALRVLRTKIQTIRTKLITL